MVEKVLCQVWTEISFETTQVTTETSAAAGIGIFAIAVEGELKVLEKCRL